MLQLAFIGFALLALVAFALPIGLLSFQRHLLFPAPKRTEILQANHHHIHRVQIPLTKGVVSGFVAVPEENVVTRKALLYFHGRRENPTSIFGSLGTLRGVHVACFSYRGQGFSLSKPDEADLVADGKQVLKWLATTASLPLSQITVVGRSLGSAIAVQVAHSSGAAKLILLSPFDKLLHVLRLRIPWLRQWMLKDRYSTCDYMPKIACPVLVVVGADDKTVPPALSEALISCCESTATVHWVAGGHRGLMRNPIVHQAIGNYCATDTSIPLRNVHFGR